MGITLGTVGAEALVAYKKRPIISQGGQLKLNDFWNSIWHKIKS